MRPIELLAVGLALLVTVAVGTVVHELAHALALDAVGIPYDIVWLPASEAGTHTWLGALASVTPRQPATPAWGLRIAALMPLVMVLPPGLALAGVVPDPTESAVGTALVVGWLACALPSPRDFAVCWYADRAVTGAVRD